MRWSRDGAGIVPVVLVVALVVATPGCLQLEQLVGGGIRTDWGYEETQVQALLDEGITGRGVRVAVVDTGIDPSHPDLQGARLAGWRDLVNGRGGAYDDNGHGSHVAGLIVARPESSDLAGGAPDVQLLVAKAIDSDGQGQDGDVAQAIDWAVGQGADVISLSLGGGRLPVLGSQTESAAGRAVDAGVYVVAAAGNDGEDDDGTVATPANVPGVVAVGAVDRNLGVAAFSSRGSQSRENVGGIGVGQRRDPNRKPEVVAPGVQVTSTVPTGACKLCSETGYLTASGTSQAVPFVSSALAQVLEARPGWQRENAEGGDAQAVERVKRALMGSAGTIPGQDTPHDDRAGYGLLKARSMRDRL